MINKISKLLKDDELWIFYTDEQSDKFFKKYISSSIVGLAVAFVTNKECKVLVSGLDEKNVLLKKDVYNSNTEFEILFLENINRFNYPKKIFLNFGNTPQIDMLGHGSYLRLESLLKAAYGSRILNFASSEDLIYEIEDSNDEIDEKYFRLSARRANEILEEVFAKIKIGMSEKEIAEITKEQFKNKPAYFAENKIESETFSWGEPCPIVLIGENLKLGGHTCPSDKRLEKGETIYFDFGVKLVANGKEYCSDIQRMGYALKDDEQIPPAEVQKVFDTLVFAIEEGRKKASTKTRGYEIDELVRGVILENGYPDYNHGTGHAVKDSCHAIGTRLSRKGIKDTERLLRNTGIYTIEPRIMIKNGGSIEEMIIVKGESAEYISIRQTKLYLI